jgi:hypothetical protein
MRTSSKKKIAEPLAAKTVNIFKCSEIALSFC